MKADNMKETQCFHRVFSAIGFGVLIFVGLFACQSAAAFDHGVFDSLLQKHVQSGRVDYAGLRLDLPKLDSYLQQLALVEINDLSRSEQLALYINAYNAFTLRLILRHYGNISSIRDLPGAWETKEWVLAGKKVSLHDIENVHLRREFKEPRIHFALNCASSGCPDLHSRAFSGQDIETELTARAKLFMASNKHVRLDGRVLYLSKIFQWFPEDFLASGTEDMVEFLRKYAPPTLQNDISGEAEPVKVQFLDYDWELNDISRGRR